MGKWKLNFSTNNYFLSGVEIITKGECAMRRQAKKEGKVFEYPPIGNDQEAAEERRQARAQAEFLRTCDDQY